MTKQRSAVALRARPQGAGVSIRICSWGVHQTEMRIGRKEVSESKIFMRHNREKFRAKMSLLVKWVFQNTQLQVEPVLRGLGGACTEASTGLSLPQWRGFKLSKTENVCGCYVTLRFLTMLLPYAASPQRGGSRRRRRRGHRPMRIRRCYILALVFTRFPDC